MFNGIGKTEIIILAIVLLVIFGPKKLPEFARGVSEAIKEMLSAFNGEKSKGTSSKKK